MMLSPAFAGLIVTAFATLGAFFGLGAGITVRRLDDRRSLSLGMAVITIGSLLGTVAPNEGVLLAARVFEGAGFLAVVLTIPSILARIVPSTERKFVMAVWSAYMPAGIMLMMLFGPLLPMIGWRNLWVATAVLTGGCCLVLAISAPRLLISAAFAIRKAMPRPPAPEPLPEAVILPLRRRSKRNHGYPPSPIAHIWRGHSTPAPAKPDIVKPSYGCSSQESDRRHTREIDTFR